MISCEASRKLTTVLGVVLLTVVSAPNRTLAQPGIMTAADRQRQLVETIQEEESGNGPMAEGLIGPLTALAMLYHEEGDQLLAAATIERVLQLMRVNYGLHTLQQAPLIRQLIEQEETWGRAAVAWELEQELLTLARRHPDDLRTVPIFREAAEKRKDWLDRYLGGESPPQIELGCYYDGRASNLEGTLARGRRCSGAIPVAVAMCRSPSPRMHRSILPKLLPSCSATMRLRDKRCVNWTWNSSGARFATPGTPFFAESVSCWSRGEVGPLR